MDRKGLAILLLAVVILFLLFAPKSSGFGAPAPIGGFNMSNTLPGSTGSGYQRDLTGASVAASTPYDGDASSASLIPREVIQTEDFGQFSPDKILSGQNYLDPRSQIGYPETVGGVLRNANQQFRSEPINPRVPVSIFNLSTISPDTMRPKFEISPEYQ
jgi:hypothetical protein